MSVAEGAGVVEISYLSRRPSGVLADGVIELSLPRLEDAVDLAAYGAKAELLEGIWVSG